MKDESDRLPSSAGKPDVPSGPPAPFMLDHIGWQDGDAMVGVGIQLTCETLNCNLVIVAPNLEDLLRWVGAKTTMQVDVSKLRAVGIYDLGLDF